MRREGKDPVDETGVELTKRAAPQPELDAIRLIRFVYARRILRGTIAAAVLGLPLWALASTVLAGALPAGSALHPVLTDHIAAGYLVLVGLIVVPLVALGVLHYTGPEARFAALVRPVLFGENDVAIERNEAVGDSTLVRIRRRGYVRVIAVVGIPIAAAAVALSASLFVPSIRGTFGSGGPVLTVGRDTRVVDVRSSTTYSSKGRGTTSKTYVISVPRGGQTTVTGGKPEDGDEVVLVRDLFGGQDAILVHGTAALETGATLLAFLAVLAGLGYWQFRAVRSERRARQRAGRPSLAEDVVAMRRGETFDLRFGQVSHSVGIRSRGDRPAPDVDRRRRRWWWVAAVAAVAVVAVPVVVVLARSGDDAAVSDREAAGRESRYVSLAGLASSGWSSRVFVVYERETSSRAYAVDQLQRGGIATPRLGASWRMLVYSADEPLRGGSAPSAIIASLHVAATTVDPARAAAGVAAHARSLATYHRQPAADVTGLPAGWRGVTTEAAGTRGAGVEVGVASAGYFVTVSTDLQPGAAGVTTAELTKRTVRLASAVAAAGVPALVTATR